MRHYLIGGSTWARTLKCPAWATFCRDNELKSVGSDAATRGTELHKQIADALTTTIDVSGGSRTHDSLVVDAYKQLELYHEENNSAFLTKVCRFGIEQTYSISETCGGSLDFWCFLTSSNTLAVVDFKFGRVDVSPVRNKQLLFYAALLVNNGLFPDFIDLVIIQPTTSSSAKTHRILLSDAIDTLDKMRDFDKKLCSEGALDFNVSNECEYCPAIGHCPKTKTEIARLSSKHTTTTELLKAFPDFKTLKRAKKTIENLEKSILEKIEGGGRVEGYDVKPKRGTRIFLDKEKMADIIEQKNLGGIAYEKKLKSPAQLKKALESHGHEFYECFQDEIASISSGNTLCEDTLIDANKITDKDKAEIKKLFGDKK